MQGKRILLVGGSSGIGLRLAHLLVNLGADLTIASRSAEQLNEAFESPVHRRKLDASCEASVKTFFVEAPRYDSIICTIKPEHVKGLFTESSISAARDAFDSKFWGQYYVAKYGAQNIAKQGSIILTSGIAASRAYEGFASTAAINSAVEALVRSLALELAPIRVNAVSPGFVERFDNDTQRLSQVSKLSTVKLPLGRLVSQQSVVEAYLYLLTSEHTTGTILTVDGGSTL